VKSAPKSTSLAVTTPTQFQQEDALCLPDAIITTWTTGSSEDHIYE